MPKDYVTPAWRTAKSAQDYVDALLDPDNANSGLAAQLEIFEGFALAAEPDADDKRHKKMHEQLKKCLVQGVERARTMHDQIDYEAAMLDKASEYLGIIETMAKWIEEDFNNPKFTGGINPYAIDPQVISHLKDRFRRRIAIAEKRVPLAGGTRNLGKDPERRDEAAIRSGIGEMAMQIMFSVPEWNPEKPTSLQLDSLSELALELFGLPNLKSNLVRYYFDTAWENLKSRFEAPPGWFGVI